MGDTGRWIAVIGGVVAVIGNFWGGGAGTSPQYYLPLIGGVIAVIGAFMK